MIGLNLGITNGQQTDEWFSKLLNQPQAPVTSGLLFQPQQQQRMLQSNQFSTMHSTRVNAPLPQFKDLSDGMPSKRHKNPDCKCIID